MNPSAKYTPQNDETRRQVEEIGQRMGARVKLFERNGRKVATLAVEFESGPDQHIDPRPEDNPAAGGDDNGGPGRDENPLH